MEFVEPERWCSMNEIAEFLGITRDTTLAWIEKRGMPGVKVGRCPLPGKIDTKKHTKVE